jgi:hypothetical protein
MDAGLKGVASQETAAAVSASVAVKSNFVRHMIGAGYTDTDGRVATFYT